MRERIILWERSSPAEKNIKTWILECARFSREGGSILVAGEEGSFLPEVSAHLLAREGVEVFLDVSFHEVGEREIVSWIYLGVRNFVVHSDTLKKLSPELLHRANFGVRKAEACEGARFYLLHPQERGAPLPGGALKIVYEYENAFYEGFDGVILQGAFDEVLKKFWGFKNG